MNYKRKIEHMNGRLFLLSEIPVLKVRREYGPWDGPESLKFHLGNNYIYIGSRNQGLKLPESGRRRIPSMDLAAHLRQR